MGRYTAINSKLFHPSNTSHSTPPLGYMRLGRHYCEQLGLGRGDIIKIKKKWRNGTKAVVRKLFGAFEHGVVFDYDTQIALGLRAYVGKDIRLYIKRSWAHPWYWNHPQTGIRLGYRFGILALLVAIVVAFFPLLI